MVENPFAILQPFSDHLTVAIFQKEDPHLRDQDVGAALGCDKVASPHQIHGTHTVVLRDQSIAKEKADGVITDTPELAILVRWADCQNFVVYAPEQNVVGVLHAGWRGVHAGAIPAFFQQLKESFDIAPKDVFIGAGPSLCTECADFTDPATELPNLDTQFIYGKHVDLRGAADAQLLELGVQSNHLERSADCTRCMPQTYWTYRGGDREAVSRAEGRNFLAAVLH